MINEDINEGIDEESVDETEEIPATETEEVEA